MTPKSQEDCSEFHDKLYKKIIVKHKIQEDSNEVGQKTDRPIGRLLSSYLR